MKKLLCALLISFAILGMVFAEDATTVEPGADNGTTSMQAEANPATSPSDSESTKAITFDAGKVKLAPEQKIGLPITLNILPGFGIGSFVQHDKLGGSIGVLLSVSAITLGVVGAGFFATGILIAGASISAANVNVGLVPNSETSAKLFNTFNNDDLANNGLSAKLKSTFNPLN